MDCEKKCHFFKNGGCACLTVPFCNEQIQSTCKFRKTTQQLHEESERIDAEIRERGLVKKIVGGHVKLVPHNIFM